MRDVTEHDARPKVRSRRPRTTGDGTRELLQWGGTMVGAGVLAALLLEVALGGFTRTGAHTNTGWFALIVALMCLPFGGLLLALGIAKWLRTRRLKLPTEHSRL
ncbi:MAG TPA: DUF202 domain-containing protein [Terracidiphilus sp.]|nr:DUF202 domain-containing protein [Terracidiphilus sp.]